MNVLFDGQAFVHQVTGGISRYFVELAAGIDVTPGCTARILAPLHRNEHLAARHTRALLGYGLPGRYRVGRICQLATETLSPLIAARTPADVVHETYYDRRPWLPRAKVRITTVHDMIHEITTPGHPTSELKRASVARADHVICVSENTRQDLCEIWGVPADKTSVVHHGYPDFSASVDAARSSALPAAPYVLFVGQRSGYKNFEALLRAFAASERLKGDLRILCFGGGPLSTAELSLASELGLGSHHLSQLRGSDKLLGNAYAHAIALAYPSLYEGFGFPPLEAMSAGCPVLVSNTSSLPEVVGDAAIKFDPKNIEELRTAIERVTVSDEVRRELIAAGHERRKQFSWPRCVERTIDVYRKLV